jgi:UPF0271 protein
MEKVYVLDTSALISHPGPLEGFTVREVIAEAKSPIAKLRGSLVSIKVVEPSTASIEKVRKSAEKTGDRLSETDLKLLALALDLKKEGKNPEILTEDYAIQNLASVLNIKFSGIGGRGIRQVLRWIWVCPSCGRSFRAEGECKFCGSRLRKKSVRYSRKEVVK